MRIWRCEGGFVFERGVTSVPVVSTAHAAIPEGPFRELQEYTRVRSDSGAVEHFRVMTWSIEEELGITVHAVIDGALKTLVVREFYSRNHRIERDLRVVSEGLEEVSDQPEAIAAVAAALS